MTALAGITTEVATRGSLSGMRVNRRDQNHPSAPPGLLTARYWNITPIGNGCSVTLTLPQGGLPDPQACRYSSWACDWGRASFHSATVTRNSVTDFSEWTVANGIPSPPPVGDGGNGPMAAKFANHPGSSMQIDVTYDATHCGEQKAVVLYGSIKDFSDYAGPAKCGGGNGGSATIDGSGLDDVWVNILWENGTVAGHPGFAFNGSTYTARTWPSVGSCDIASDQQDYGLCP
jgi:hypothetical protein